MNLTIKDIQKKLSEKLPGEEAHVPISPVYRKKSSESLKYAVNYDKSAVSFIIYEKNEELFFILMQRPFYPGVHGGQVSLPGGKMEEIDTDLVQTAIRESEEEIGLEKENFKLLGQLTPVFIPVSNFLVQPYVFFYNTVPHFKPDHREVLEVFDFPLSSLLQNNIIEYTDLDIDYKTKIKDVPHFRIKNKIVWGATAMILNEFRWIFNIR